MSLIINRIIDNFLLSNDIILSHDFTILITPSYYNIPSTEEFNSVEFEQISRRSRRNSEIRGTNDRRDYIRKPKRRGVQEFGKSLIKSNRSLANSNPAIWTPPLPPPCHPSNWSYRPRQITDLPFSFLPPRSFSYYVAARISGRC